MALLIRVMLQLGRNTTVLKMAAKSIIEQLLTLILRLISEHLTRATLTRCGTGKVKWTIKVLQQMGQGKDGAIRLAETCILKIMCLQVLVEAHRRRRNMDTIWEMDIITGREDLMAGKECMLSYRKLPLAQLPNGWTEYTRTQAILT